MFTELSAGFAEDRAAGDKGPVVRADFTGDDGSEVLKASYTTGKAGNQLVWLPYRPSATKSASKIAVQPQTPAKPAQRVQFTSPGTAKPLQPAKPIQPGRAAFADPFGDANRMSQAPSSPTPIQLPGDNLLKGTPLPLPTDAFPSIPPGEFSMEGESFQQSEDIGESALEEQMAAGPNVATEECLTASDVKAIGEISYDISPPGTVFPQSCPLLQQGAMGRNWIPTTFTWKASALCHKPAYFEQIHVERYGHSWGPFLQPVLSGGHFFLTVPLLPYKMGLNPPNECIYTLGYYRPGNCAPYLLDPLPISIRAGLAQAGVVTGLGYAIP